MLEGSTAIAFYIISFVMILSAIAVVTLKNIFHAALFLVLALFAVAALYILLSAEFLAAVQVLIYVGAISILMIFAVMLTAQLTNYNIKQTNEQSLPALLISICFIAVTIFAIATNYKLGGFPLAENPEVGGSNTARLGHLLMRDFILPFEVVSVLLLAALIGAIVIAKRDK
ncbi:MAG: NADH-quinone oxidoreductase subunit J [Aliifodinibius sp.]|nr:NADH-quinone oxidoreductase subunit J [candidate division Zixibacteria bacterium]NIT58708.1 NADH-quinone oxidoreductase subunit J [Fodinibius sp.]NIX57468.1 NADH-quinone oxidoreductase subunit J [candidate division Zixibacteria bacterium]NIY27291.1 NADH-quinone oxidoreductase subunit J [Fodinibius sp.]